MRSRPVSGVLAGLTLTATLAGACTSSGPAAPTFTTTNTRTVTGTRTVGPGPVGPVPSGPTTAAQARSCPLLPTGPAAKRVGMRLARITVLRSAGKVVGCRFYALQGSTLSESEHLPGPKQPAIEIEVSRYRSATDAHNAFVRAADKGRNPQQFTVSVDNTGVCYQIPFYPPDHGRDWACAFSDVTRTVVVRTVADSAFNVQQVARVVARRL